MKPAAARFLLLLAAHAALWGQFGAAPTAKVNTTAGMLAAPRQSMQTVEKLIDTRLYALGTANDPVDMLCCSRGVYLSNFGAIFLSEMSLIVTPGSGLIRPAITEDLKRQVHQKKIDRLPALRKAMGDLLRTAAQNLPQAPDSQIFVVAVRLDYLSWEDRTGLPDQVVARADRRSILAGNIQVTEEQ
jgi:hypothetical protein